MSVLVKGIEMPKNCDNCWALDEYGDYPRCRITEEQRGYNFPIREKRMDDCPFVPVPLHGRLIDADDFFRSFPELIPYEFAAPTIIQAEEVYGQYTDTAGNFHWCGTHSGEHTIKAEEGE